MHPLTAPPDAPAASRWAGLRALWAAVAVGALVAAATVPPPAAALLADVPATAEAGYILDVEPAPGVATTRGVRGISAVVTGSAVVSSVAVDVDGAPVGVDVSGAPPRQRLDAATGTLRPGTHEARIVVRTADGSRLERRWRFTVANLAVTRLGGRTRTDTARVVAEELQSEGPAPTAVVARSDGFADALAGVGLAHALGGPLLLSAPGGLDDATRRALADSVAPGATVHLLGGAVALSAEVAAEVAALGYGVERIAGRDRFATAAAVARVTLAAAEAGQRPVVLADPDAPGRAAAARPGDDPPRAVVASGEDFADALAVSPPAATRGWPVILTARGQLPGAARDLLEELGLDRITVVGGTAAVSDAVVSDLRSIAPVDRISGASRFETAARIATELFEPGDVALLASGGTYADALTGAVAAARWDAPLLLAAGDLPAASANALATRDATDLRVLGGEAAVSDAAVRGAVRASVDGGHAVVEGPEPGTRFTLADEPGAGFGRLRVRLPGASLSDTSQVSLTIDGRETVVTGRVEGDILEAVVAVLPPDLPAHGDVPVRLTVALTSGGRTVHDEVPLVLRIPRTSLTTAEGYIARAGEGPVVGGGGPLHTYSVEVEPAADVDVRAFAEEVDAILADPRSWTGPGTVRLQRVEPAQARIRVVLARPTTVDALCRRAGLDTAGTYSCWNGQFAALNLDRWLGGTAVFSAPLGVYRGYLVNHEVGHGLGHGHLGCPRAGNLAPVMMQQSKGTDGCRPNAWPYP